MSDRRKKPEFDAKREKRRLMGLADQRRLEEAANIPPGAVASDPAQQVPNNSYSPAPLYYVDKEFVCQDCGRREIWTAKQQKWYYEVAKGSLYASAVRCRECRRSRAERTKGLGDPNPIKHVGSLMKRIRRGIESTLFAAGFELEGRSYGADSRSAWLDYVRPDLILRCGFNSYEAQLIAETMDDDTNCRLVATIALDCPRTSAELLGRVDKFSSVVNEYVRSHLTAISHPDRNDA